MYTVKWFNKQNTCNYVTFRNKKRKNHHWIATFDHDLIFRLYVAVVKYLTSFLFVWFSVSFLVPYCSWWTEHQFENAGFSWSFSKPFDLNLAFSSQKQIIFSNNIKMQNQKQVVFGLSKSIYIDLGIYNRKNHFIKYATT